MRVRNGLATCGCRISDPLIATGAIAVRFQPVRLRYGPRGLPLELSDSLLDEHQMVNGTVALGVKKTTRLVSGKLHGFAPGGLLKASPARYMSFSGRSQEMCVFGYARSPAGGNSGGSLALS